MSLIDTTGRLLMTLSALFVITGPYIFDWNETHVQNPNWTPHAKFHNGQTMSFGPALGLPAIYLLWTSASSASNVSPMASAALERFRLRAATYLTTIYWLTQASAQFYPGSLCVDPEFGGAAMGCPQVMPQVLCLSLAVGGFVLANGAVEGKVGGKKRA